MLFRWCNFVTNGSTTIEPISHWSFAIRNVATHNYIQLEFSVILSIDCRKNFFSCTKIHGIRRGISSSNNEWNNKTFFFFPRSTLIVNLLLSEGLCYTSLIYLHIVRDVHRIATASNVNPMGVQMSPEHYTKFNDFYRFEPNEVVRCLFANFVKLTKAKHGSIDCFC